MRLHGGDVWGHFAPMFHLVDAFAIYAMTLLGARHVILPAFNASDALLTLGACCCAEPSTSAAVLPDLLYSLAMHVAVCWQPGSK